MKSSTPASAAVPQDAPSESTLSLCIVTIGLQGVFSGSLARAQDDPDAIVPLLLGLCIVVVGASAWLNALRLRLKERSESQAAGADRMPTVPQFIALASSIILNHGGQFTLATFVALAVLLVTPRDLVKPLTGAAVTAVIATLLFGHGIVDLTAVMHLL